MSEKRKAKCRTCGSDDPAVLADLREAGELRTLEQVGWASEGAHVHLMGMDRERTEWEFRYFTVPVWVEVGREDTDE